MHRWPLAKTLPVTRFRKSIGESPDRPIQTMPATPRPKLDLSQLGKRILDEATGDAPKTKPPAQKNAAAVELGKLGGKKGGAARATKLTAEQRSEIATKAAQARWKSR
jgi:hypothetical protein